MPVLLRGWSTRASINWNSSGRAYSFWSITTVRKHRSPSLSHTHWASEMHIASWLLVIAWRIITEIAIGRYTQGASKSGMFATCMIWSIPIVSLTFFGLWWEKQEIWLWKSLSIVHSFVIWGVFQGLKMRTQKWSFNWQEERKCMFSIPCPLLTTGSQKAAWFLQKEAWR
jgi:hypothetical protein